MDLSVYGRNVSVTLVLKAYVVKRFERIKRLLERASEAHVHVTLSGDKLVRSAQVVLRLSGSELVAESSDQDLHSAIDLVMDKLHHQVLKRKGKLFGVEHVSHLQENSDDSSFFQE